MASKMQKVAEDFGYQLAFLKSDKELYSVFTKAVNGGWDATRFVSAVRGTKWYKTHGETYRQNQQLKYTDPKTYSDNLDNQMVTVQQAARAMGVDVSYALRKSIATDAMMFGWSQEKINNALAGWITRKGSTDHGLTGQVEDALQQTAYRNGLNISRSTILTWAKRVANGVDTIEQAQQYFRDHYAKTLAPGFAKQLEAGQDLYDLASPYMQTMAKTLEISPAEVDLFDPTIRKALASSSDKDGEVGSQPLWDFERSLKKDRRWLATSNARDEVDKATRMLAQTFGKAV